MKTVFSSKLAWLTLTVVSSLFFANLGLWQWERSDEKARLIQLQQDKMSEVVSAPIVVDSDQKQSYQYSRVRLQGHFVNQLQWYLDNKTYQGKVGYEVITGFKTKEGDIIFVNRGWVQGYADRTRLPKIDVEDIDITIEGTLVFPSVNQFINNDMSTFDTFSIIPQIAFSQLTQTTVQYAPNADVANYVVLLAPQSKSGFHRDWKFTNMPPEKHIAYAIQWFGIAITIWIIFFILSFRKSGANK